MKFEVEPELPPIRRNTRAEEDLGDLLDALEGGKAISVSEIGTPREGQQLAMRVRYFASKRGFKITQRYRAGEQKLYLQRVE